MFQKILTARPKLLTIALLSLSFLLASGDALAAKRSHSSSSRKSSSRKSGSKKSGRDRRDRGTRASRSKKGRGREVASRGRGRRGRHSRRRRGYDVAEAGSTPRVTGIPSDRAIEIQNALIKRGYLEGPPSGQWDDQTVDAMKSFQADNGLSPTGQPSAPSLKRLGVSKRPQDGYAVPVTRVAAKDENKTRDQQKEKKP